MAVKLITSLVRYSGLSTDTKPTTCAVGSSFYEEDHGHSFQYDGATWVKAFPNIDVDAHGALVTVTHFEHEIHAGHMFVAPYAETLASGSASIILFETPGSAVASVHFMAILESSAAGTMYLSETPNATVGTAVTAQNANRIIAGSNETSITSNGAITTAGTVLEYGVVGSGAAKKVGGEVEGSRRVLEHSTRYSLSFTCSAAANVAWKLFLIEEPA